MKKKQYLLLRAWLTTAMAVLFISLVLAGKVDGTGGYVLGIIFTSVAAFMAYGYFRKAGKTSEEETINTAPANATDTQMIRFYKRMLLFGSVAFLLLTLFVVYDVNSLLNGGTQENELWDLVSLLYHQLGYWPTILFIPALALLWALVTLRKINVLKSKY